MSKFFETVSSRSSSINSSFLKSSNSISVVNSSTAVPTTKKLTRDNLHKLSDFWSLYYHHRSTTHPQSSHPPQQLKPKSNDEETSTVGESTLESTEQQPQIIQTPLAEYLQDIHLVEFPLIGSPLNENTVKIDSVEELWQSMVNTKKPHDLPFDTELFMFKNDIKPIWEDPANALGGRWVFSFDRTNHKLRSNPDKRMSKEEYVAALRHRVSLIWERLILKLCSRNFIPSDNLFKDIIADDICGITLSVRDDRDIICIWNTHVAYNQYVKDEVTRYKEVAKRLHEELLNDDDLKLHEALDSIIDEDANSELEHFQQELRAEAQEEAVEDEPLESNRNNNELDSNADGESTINKKKDFREIIKLTPFLLRRGMADAMYRVINEADMIFKDNVSPIYALDDGTSIDIKNNVDRSKYKIHNYSKQGNNNNNKNKKLLNKKDAGKRKRRTSNNSRGNSGIMPKRGSESGTNGYSNAGNSVRKYKPRRFNKEGGAANEDGDSGHLQQHFYHNHTYVNTHSSSSHSQHTNSNTTNTTTTTNNNNTNNENEGGSSLLDNKFSELGKQRKRLDLDGEGNAEVDEVNMLSFGSRRRRMLQQQLLKEQQQQD